MAAGVRLRYKDAKVAIYTVPTVGTPDDGPLNTPLSHLSRIKFSSSLAYTKVVTTVTTTLELPSVQNTRQRVASYAMFTHGLAGQPWILGKIEVLGFPVAFVGSVPVQSEVDGSPYARFLSLGADSTTVWIHEYCPMRGNAGANRWASLPAINIPIEIYVTDEILSS